MQPLPPVGLLGQTSAMTDRVGAGAEPGALTTTVDSDCDHDRLARRARLGDHEALQALLELIDADGSIRVPVRRVIVNAQQVEDVSQDVLVLVAERIGSWEGHSRFTTWLYALSRNRAIDHLRCNRPMEPMPDDVVSEQQRISSLIATRQTVQQLLDRLPDSYRIAVSLREIDGLEYDDIGRLLGVHPDTVRARVYRGRAMLAARCVSPER